ncbi:MAG: inorganic diphosphatase [Acidobacteriota bacterium]|nr:inorganic diphosphatase [Acidobacteriota bacterium]
MTSLLPLLFTITLSASQTPAPCGVPPFASAQLTHSLAESRAHTVHLWRDTAPLNSDGTVNAYIEIPMGEKRKFEFSMKANERAIDRVMPDSMGGYPVNYGYVPQTVSYDGDPFDVLVLGPALPGGGIVRGVIVGLMFMEDEKGLDAKVVVSVPGPDGRPLHTLTAADQERIGDYFKRYKLHEPGKFSKIPGWGTIADGRAHVDDAHRFFRVCGK